MEKQLVHHARKAHHSARLLFIIILVFFQFCSLSAQVPSYPIKTVNGVECIVYKVKPAEGFYRISKNFNTTEDIIRAYNPHAADGLKAGMEIYIPIHKEEPKEKNYIEHVVERQQTLYRISKIYDITQEELLAANPQITGRAIQTGEVLKIPTKKGDKVEEVAEEVKRETELSGKEVQQQVEEIFSGKDLKIDQLATRKPQKVKIAFLLPFLLEQNQDAVDRRFVEFYAGALAAINQGKQEGISFDIYTFDTDKSDIKIMEILKDSMPWDIDLIVGPAYSNQISIVSDYARNNKIKTLIPFSSKIFDIESNPYIYQFNPGQEIELQKILEILRTEGALSQIVFAELPQVNTTDDGLTLTNMLKHHLNASDTPYKTIQLHPDSLEYIWNGLDPWKENIIFFNTTRINNLNIYLREFNRLSTFVKIKIYEPYSWRSSKLERPRSFYLSAFKNEFPNEKFDYYINSFADLFDWSPSEGLPRYDLLGYDLLSYFIKYILPKNEAQIDYYPFSEGIQSDMQYEKVSPRGGYLNRLLIHYE